MFIDVVHSIGCYYKIMNILFVFTKKPLPRVIFNASVNYNYLKTDINLCPHVLKLDVQNSDAVFLSNYLPFYKLARRM